MKSRLLAVVCSALAILSGCGLSSSASPNVASTSPVSNPGASTTAHLSTQSDSSKPLAADQGTVSKVVDGDTIHVKIGSTVETIRLIGINTPETVDPRKPVQCFGAEAKARMKELLPVGTTVRLERDAEARDKYGRLLAYIYRVSDDVFINITMAREGFADVMTIAPNVAHADEFVDAVRQARDTGTGLWSRCESFGATVTT